MSESRTHVEIEDVLSSIRRLVSQDGQLPRRTGLFRAAESSLPTADPAAPQSQPECLVLTPALRVVEPEPESPIAGAAEAPPTSAQGYEDPQGDPAPSPPETTAEDSWPSDALADWQAADATLSLEVAKVGPQPTTTGEDDPTGAAVVFDPGWRMPPPAPDLQDEISRLESTIAELEAAVAASDEAFEPEQGDVFADAAAAPALAAAFVPAEPRDTAPRPETSAATAPAPEPAQMPQPEPEPEPEFSAAAGPELTPEQPAAMPEPAEEPEAPAESAPDLATLPDAADEPASEPLAAAVEWVDPINPSEAELTASDWAEEMTEAEANIAALEAASPRRLHLADAAPESKAPEAPTSSYAQMQSEAEADLIAAVHDSLLQDPEDSLIDEEALRELVSEIIRQELQGTLGERITRSVRKLVRREIARALAGRDLE
jgi:hypothetical protein